jgi:hypothetical protein
MNSEQDLLHLSGLQDSVRGYDGLGEDASISKRDLRGSSFVSGRSIRCTAEHCSSSGVCVLELQPFCLHHFIMCCFERLRLCSVSWCLNPGGSTNESYDAFIRECITKTANLLQDGTNVDPVRRSHLLDVFLWASELAVKLSLLAPGDAAAQHAEIRI